MKAYLRSAPVAPKKADLIAKMVRGMTVPAALDALAHTHKKSARFIEKLLKSAVANAEHNEKQKAQNLVIKSIIVNQSLGYKRGIPKARGQMRPITKFLSHISISLGVAGEAVEKVKAKTKVKKDTKPASQESEKKVQKAPVAKKKASSESSESSTPSHSS